MDSYQHLMGLFLTENILGHKASLNMYKRIKITPCILCDNHMLKLDTNNDKNLQIHRN